MYVCVGDTDFFQYIISGSQLPIFKLPDVCLKQKEIKLFSLKITSEYISLISKQTCKIFLNTCDFGIIWNLIIKQAPLGVITINIPESDFTDDSCTILDALHNFGNVRCSL